MNEEKTERIRLSGGGRKPYDVRGKGGKFSARHVGGWIAENGKQDEDTKRKTGRGW